MMFAGMLRGDTSGALAYWVGGNDLDSEQGWKWTDRKPFKYFNWNNGKVFIKIVHFMVCD